MNIKILAATITVSLLLAGCGKTLPANVSQQQNEQVNPAATTNNPASTAQSNSIEYNQYVKKTWIKNESTSINGNGNEPCNLKDVEGFSPIESQSFMVNLNSWGNVKFVSGKLTAGNHIPLVFYLTNTDGDILYNFNAALPYSVDVKAVSFEDVNKDGLKDIIIIVAGDDGPESVATVYFQEADGSFANDAKLNQEINDSGNNKDIKTVKNFLEQKF